MHTDDVIDRLFLEWMRTKPDFSPHAYYIEALDKVIVVVEDCSTHEEHIKGSSISLHRRNYEVDGKRNYVGFEIDGVQDFCKYHQICFGEKMDLSSILKKMAETNAKALPAILDVAIPMIEDDNINTVIF
jgi:hypothetical protein